MTLRLVGFSDRCPPHSYDRRMIPCHLWSSPWAVDDLLPERLWGQHFGLGLFQDDVDPLPVSMAISRRPKRKASEKKKSTKVCEVSNTDKEFRVCLDASHFRPEELTIKAVNNRVIVHGKHEEKEDEGVYIQREFCRTYVLPDDVDPNAVKSSLSSDGILAIHAPKEIAQKPSEKTIPIDDKMDAEQPPAAEGNS